MSFMDYIPGRNAFWNWAYVNSMHVKKGDSDVLLEVFNEDGVRSYERGYFESDLIGDMSGFESETGAKYVVEGIEGNPKTDSTSGVPIVPVVPLHASTIEPIKAVIAQRVEQDGEHVTRVDEQGNPLQDPHPRAGGNGHQARADGGTATAGGFMSENTQTHAADKQVDLEPPEHDGEQADGFVVSLAKSAAMLPRKISPEQIQLHEDRVKAAESNQNELLKGIFYGAVGVFATIIGFIIVMWLLNQIGGGGGGTNIGLTMAPDVARFALFTAAGGIPG